MASQVLILFFVIGTAVVTPAVDAVPIATTMKPGSGQGVISTTPAMLDAVRDCNMSHPVPMVQLQDFNMTGKYPYMVTKDHQCFFKCFLEKAGMNKIDDMSLLPKTKIILKDADISDVSKWIEKCSRIFSEKKEECEKAYLYASCLAMEDIAWRIKNNKQ